MATTQSKRFEDWEKVDCNECARYWDSSCDGICKGSEKPCNSFLATRSVVIPARIKELEKWNKWLTFGVVSLDVLFILHIVFQVMGWV